MQKLEEILRAEEAARHTLATARERAEQIVRDAEAAAGALLSEIRSEALREATELKTDRLSAAERQAEELVSEISKDQARILDAARRRVDDAVQAALARIQG